MDTGLRLSRIMFGDRNQIIKLKDKLDKAARKISELEKEYNSVKTVLESMIEGVITVDRDTRIVSINSAVEKIFGIIKQDAEGKFFLEVIRNSDIAEIINKVLKNGKFISQELNLVWPIQRKFLANL